MDWWVGRSSNRAYVSAKIPSTPPPGHTGCPWELLYADDLVIITSLGEELNEKLRLWKHQVERQGSAGMEKTYNLTGSSFGLTNLRNSLKDMLIGVQCLTVEAWVLNGWVPVAEISPGLHILYVQA